MAREIQQDQRQDHHLLPASDNEVIEVRQVQEFSDFPDDVKKAAAGFTEMQAQAGQRKKS